MPVAWTNDETWKLIEFWGENGIQEQLEGCTRSKHVYGKLSYALAKEGVTKSGEQCRRKMKKLRQDYKKIKDKHKLTGRGEQIGSFMSLLTRSCELAC